MDDITERMKDDRYFLGYVEIHSETERALFSGTDVIRLHRLAGKEASVSEDGFYAMHDDYAKPLVKIAREKLDKKDG